MKRLPLGMLALLFPSLFLVAAPVVRELHTEAVGPLTYCRVRLDAPGLVPEGPLPWMELPTEPLPLARDWWPAPAPSLVPRFISTDLRLACRVAERGDGVTIVGRVLPALKTAKGVLHYPTRDGGKLLWKQIAITLDLTKATPAEGLERQWARAQVDELEAASAEAPDFGFYSFAATTLARRHEVFGLRVPATRQVRSAFTPDRLYELTTGATAITESLQLRRMTVEPGKEEPRTVEVKSLRGIEIAEHPWRQMMGDKKPAAEPLATMIPHDNYYITFRETAKLFEFAGLLETWGGNLTRAYEFTSRDYRLWQRYERQLCLTDVAYPGVTRVAITGNDAYVRDGTDLTVLLACTDPKDLLAALDAGVGTARKEQRDRLAETRTRTEGRPTVESFVSPLREVSLHRAVVGNVVVLSNSPVGLRRVLDTAAGKGQRLADALDFQYMRTVFRASDAGEAGFAYLPDAFIRAFVGPAARIKQKRRLEALTSLHMLTNGAMFTAWETGKLPASLEELLRGSGLKPGEVAVPEGVVRWDAEQRAAVSSVHGSIHFATPLVELDIDRVTATEAREYDTFRTGYARLWRQFFDPIGMRLALTEGEIKLETYILPLIQSQFYAQLRDLTANGTTRIDPETIAPTTLLQYRTHLNPMRVQGVPQLKVIGDWVMVRMDDSADYAKWFAPLPALAGQAGIAELIHRAAGLPLAVGVAVKDEKESRQLLKQCLPLLQLLTAQQEGLKVEFGGGTYKEVALSRVTFKVTEPREAALHVHIAIFDGAAYASVSEMMMHRLIDEAESRHKQAAPLAQWPAFVNSSLYASPAAVKRARPLLTRLAELPTNQEARAALATWQALYRTGIVSPEGQPDETAFRFLGYVPAAPDRTAFRYDLDTGEVVSVRHGSARAPVLADGLAPTSPLARVLDNLRGVRVDLRFREDGIHTTLHLTRRAGVPALSKAALADRARAALASPDPRERLLALAELGQFDADSRAILLVLQACLYHQRPELYAIGNAVLGKLDPKTVGTPAALREIRADLVAQLLLLLDARHNHDRSSVADLLAHFGLAARAAVPSLQALQFDFQLDVRNAAEAALARIDPQALKPATMSQEVRAKVLAHLLGALTSSNSEQRQFAVERLGKLGPEAKSAVPPLRAALFERGSQLRHAAEAALHNIDPTALDPATWSQELREQTLAKLTAGLASPLTTERCFAAAWLGKFGPHAKSSIPVLQVALFDSAKTLREAAAAALRAIDPAAADPEKLTPEARAGVLSALKEALRSSDRTRQRWAEVTLPRFAPEGPRVLAEEFLWRALGSKNLGLMREAVGTVVQSKDASPEVRAAAVNMCRKELRLGLREERLWAAEMLGRIGPGAQAAVPELKAAALTEWAEDVRQAASAALRLVETPKER